MEAFLHFKRAVAQEQLSTRLAYGGANNKTLSIIVKSFFSFF